MKVRLDGSTVLSALGVGLTSLLALIAFDLGVQLGWLEARAAKDGPFILAASSGDRSTIRISPAMRKEFAQRCTVCEATATYASDVAPVLSRENGRSHFAEVVHFQGDFWGVWRPKVLAGRLSGRGGEGKATGVAVLSGALWRSLFGEQPFEVPRNVFIDAQPFEVIGVVEAESDGLFARAGIWLEQQSGTGDLNTDQVGLVRTTNLEQAQAMLQMATGPMKALGGTSWAERVEGYSLRSATAYLRSKSGLADEPIRIELVICAACSVLCFTAIVFLLLLVGMRRSAIEAALGASVFRTARGRVREQAGVVLAGGLLAGLCFFWIHTWSARYELMSVTSPPGLQPAQLPVALGILVLGQLVLLTVLSTLMHHSYGARNQLGDLMQGQGMSGIWRRQQMVAVGTQYFVALVGLVLTVGFVLQLAALRTRDTGLLGTGQRLIALRLPQSLEEDPQALAGKVRALLTVLAAQGQAGQAVVTNGLPFLQVNAGPAQVFGAKSSGKRFTARIVSTTNNYFSQLGVRMLTGNVWAHETADHIVVNRAFANLTGGLVEATGSEVRLGGKATSRFTIAGVCENAFDAGEDFQAIPTVYVPILALPATELTLWTKAAQRQWMQWVEEVQSREPSYSLYFTKSFDELVEGLTATETSRVQRFSLMAGVATASTLFSLGFLMVSALRSNRREYAILYALGCRPHHLMQRLVRRHAGWAVLLSVAAAVWAQQLSAKFNTGGSSAATLSGELSVLVACLLVAMVLSLMAGLVWWTMRGWDHSLPRI